MPVITELSRSVRATPAPRQCRRRDAYQKAAPRGVYGQHRHQSLICLVATMLLYTPIIEPRQVSSFISLLGTVIIKFVSSLLSDSIMAPSEISQARLLPRHASRHRA